MRPEAITRGEQNSLRVSWEGGDVVEYPLQFLRRECPCAHCKGENILGKVYKPTLLPTYVEGMNELVAVEPVGGYAIRIRWGDGHDTGIYTWEFLRVLAGELRKKEREKREE